MRTHTHENIPSPRESLDLFEERAKNLGARALLDNSLNDTIPRVAIEGVHRQLIGPESPIDGGVYIDTGGKTAIIVDREHDQTLKRTLELLAPAYERIRQIETRSEGLIGLTSLIAKIFTYSDSAVTSLYRTDYGDRRRIVPRHLGEFVASGVGVCVQQALLTSASLEYAISSGILPSGGCSVSFESGYDATTGERHAYTLFAIDHTIWQLDPTQQRHKRALTYSDPD